MITNDSNVNLPLMGSTFSLKRTNNSDPYSFKYCTYRQLPNIDVTP
jgi:hypothetical protein